MIYLGRDSYYNEESGQHYFILKIGYTRDGGEVRRLDIYKSHNPSFKFLKTITGGTEDHEKRLHYKFKHLRVIGREWFQYSGEILEFFQECTLGDLEKLPLNPGITEKQNKTLLKSWKVMKLLDYVSRKESTEIDNILQLITTGSIKVEDIFKDLKCSNHFPSLISKTWKEVEDELFSSLPSEVLQFFQEYDSLTTYVEKIHYIVDYLLEFSERSEAILGNLSDSDKIKQQLISLGPERIKGLGYHITKINKAMGITIFNKQDFLREIQNVFTVNSRYTKKFIKEKLGEIYRASDFQGTPKASDLGEWFEIKEIRMTVEGRKVPGFEILSRK